MPYAGLTDIYYSFYCGTESRAGQWHYYCRGVAWGSVARILWYVLFTAGLAACVYIHAFIYVYIVVGDVILEVTNFTDSDTSWSSVALVVCMHTCIALSYMLILPTYIALHIPNTPYCRCARSGHSVPKLLRRSSLSQRCGRDLLHGYHRYTAGKWIGCGWAVYIILYILPWSIVYICTVRTTLRCCYCVS